MAVRHVLLAAVAALGLAGCTSAVAGQAVPAVHPVLRFRPVLVDPSSGAPMILPVTPPSTGAVADPNQAKTIRQNPAVASDPNAQQLAFAALDCAKPDPLHAADDPHALAKVRLEPVPDLEQLLRRKREAFRQKTKERGCAG